MSAENAAWLAIVVVLIAFQIAWIALHWDFFRPGGQLHREIYHSDLARRMLSFTAKFGRK